LLSPLSRDKRRATLRPFAKVAEGAFPISTAPTIPLCPITGAPAVRRIQWVTTRLLEALWRIAVKTDARSSFGDLTHFGLWESPTGLYFFDPPLEGDHTFYTQFYAWLRKRGLYSPGTIRQEFVLAGERIPAGSRVLDVGCGPGNFRQCVPDSDYTGLDPHFADIAAVAGVRNETLAEHLVENEASYDAVCCFQVIEHVRDPATLFKELVRAAKPGGLICVGAPGVPSALSRVPNFLVNAPPHHLTWWTKSAFESLANSAGVVVEGVENAPWGESDAMMYWISRCSPIKCTDVFYRGGAKWHLASLTGHVGGYFASKLFGAPRNPNDEGASLVLFARRPMEAV
jgi:SAM-dependent methyltransferase